MPVPARARFGAAGVEIAHCPRTRATSLGYQGQLAAAVPLLARAVAAEHVL